MSRINQQIRIQNRNYRLVARFYFYSTIIGLKFSRVIENLENEFNLSEGRICDLIAQHSDLLTQFETKNVTSTELKQKFPFMVWTYTPPAKRLKNPNQLSLSPF